MKRALLAIVIFVIPAMAAVQGSFERSFQVSGPVDLEVLTRSGDITVRAGASGSVVVRGKIHVGDSWLLGGRTADVQGLEKNPPLRQSGNSIRIDYVNLRNIAIDYDITVPADTSVRSHSGSGDQTIAGVRKGADLESGSGDMQLRDLAGALRVRTGSGNIRAEAISGAFEAQAGSGDIILEEKGAGDVQVRTGSGNIELREINGGLQAEAGSGDVRVSGTQSKDWNVRTGSGNVDLRLPSGAAFDLDASTGSGTLEVGHPVTMTIEGRVREHPRTIRGKVRGGGLPLTVHTGSGDIRID